MADECTDITVMEELSVFCCWEEEGTPVECFLDIEPLKKADAGSIYLALVKCIKNTNFRLAKSLYPSSSPLQPLSTALHYIISGQAQQKSSNKTV